MGGHRKSPFRRQYPRVELATPLPAHDLEVVPAGVAAWDSPVRVRWARPCPSPAPAPRPPLPLALAPGEPGAARAALTHRAGGLSSPPPPLELGATGTSGELFALSIRVSGPGVGGGGGGALPWGEFWAQLPWLRLCRKVCLPSCFGAQLCPRSDTPSRSDAASGPS